MFICMAGMPSSGKTELVKKFVDATDREVVIIDPKEYVPDDIDDLPEEEQKRWRIASWEVCLKYVKGALHEPNSKIVILDTAAASSLALHEIFTFAKLKEHYIVHVFMVSKISECKNRAGKTWIGKEAAVKYADRFKVSVPELRKLSDEYLVVKNTGDDGLKNIEKAATQLDALADRHE